MDERKAYPSDLSDEQWAVVGPFLDAWKARHPSVSGHHGRYELREIVNAIFYQNRTGCQWAYLPHDLPPKSATYYYFALWRDDGTDQAIHDLLRCQVRERAGRAEDPSAIGLDTQSIRAANHVPAATTGKDAGKKTPGRKRGLAVDALGLIIAVVVTAASVTDTVIGVRLLDKVVEHTPTVTQAWVDAGFKHDLAIHGALLGIDVEVVKRSDTQPGFVPIAKRWVVEQTNGTVMLHRRLVREYESRPESSVSHTLWASAATLVRRLAGPTHQRGGIGRELGHDPRSDHRPPGRRDRRPRPATRADGHARRRPGRDRARAIRPGDHPSDPDHPHPERGEICRPEHH
jgi:transposase